MKTTEPPMDSRTLGCWFLLAIAAVLAFVIAVWAFQSAMEARAFNRATGKNVSTWDAMWIELRVQDAPR